MIERKPIYRRRLRQHRNDSKQDQLADAFLPIGLIGDFLKFL
jgi:hypothetical protein